MRKGTGRGKSPNRAEERARRASDGAREGGNGHGEPNGQSGGLEDGEVEDRNGAAYERRDNRTGVATAKEPVDEMILAVEEFAPEPDPDGKDLIAEVRIEFARLGEPSGTMPELCGCDETDEQHAQHAGPELTVLLDKLGERLAFERTGVRLYDALISKYDAYGSWPGGPLRAELERIREEELAHFHLLGATIDRLGGDPTAVTPSANLAGVASKGLMQVLTDPRNDLAQSMEAILIAELADNDCWATLSQLALGFGTDELTAAFDAARENEEQHLALVREWLAARLGAIVSVGTGGGSKRRRARDR